jgi:hypothetical protein
MVGGVQVREFYTYLNSYHSFFFNYEFTGHERIYIAWKIAELTDRLLESKAGSVTENSNENTHYRPKQIRYGEGYRDGFQRRNQLASIPWIARPNGHIQPSYSSGGTTEDRISSARPDSSPGLWLMRNHLQV